jgi:phosphonate transport system substrate-binding protein
MLEAGEVDVAFVCGGPYVDGHEKFGMELLVAPKAYGETVYYSYIIARKDSSIKSFENVRGKKFAFTDPLSNSGKLVPTYMLAKMQESPKTFFESSEFTYAHDKSIQAVAEGIVDAAAVDSLIWEYMNRITPDLTSKTEIVKKSAPYGIPPVVVRPDMDPSLKKKLRGIFLGVHEDKKGREILKGMMIDKFVVIDDSNYDSIREMKQWLANYNESNG